MSDLFAALVAVAIGLALSAACGLRAFVPLLAAGLAIRTGRLPGGAEWLGQTPALIALSVAVVVEIAADKVPAVDHLLDVVGAPLRTAAGVVVASAVVADVPTWATALCAVVGGGAALSVHATKSFVRLGSTAATAGVANPILSLLEDVTCIAATVLSILVWFLAVLVALAALAWMVSGARKIRALRRRGTKDVPHEDIKACPR